MGIFILKSLDHKIFQLECQCISAISFGGPPQTEDNSKMRDILDLPIWIMAINIVAMEMLRTKLPPPPSKKEIKCTILIWS